MEVIMKLDFEAKAVLIILLIFVGDSFLFDLPYVWSWGGADSGNDTIDYLHAMNRKMNLMFGFLAILIIKLGLSLEYSINRTNKEEE